MGAAMTSAIHAVEIVTERNTLLAFLEVLQSEQDALVHGDAERVGALASEKADLVARLGQLGEECRHRLVSQALTADRDGMESFLRRNPGAAAAWREVLSLAEKAQQLNQTNGLMINTRLGHTRQALAVLHSAADASGLYGPDGHPSTLTGGRQLGAV